MASAVDPSSTRSRISSAFRSGRNKKGASAENSDREETSSTTTSERRNSLEGATASRTQSYSSRPTSRRNSESGNRNRKLSVFLKRRNKKQSGGDDVSPLAQDESLASLQTTNSSKNDLELDDNASGSLLTEDSEEPRPVRPSLSPHHSHAGYLTLSSPTIQAELVDPDDSIPPVPPIPDLSANPFAAKSTTLDAPQSSTRRSPSPVGRLREALSPTKKLSSSNLEDFDRNGSPGPLNEGDIGGKLKGLIARGRRGSSSSRRGSKVLEDRPVTAPPGVNKPPPLKQTPISSDAATDPPSTPPRDRIDGPTTVITPPTPTGPRVEDQGTPTPNGKKGDTVEADFPTPPARAASPPVRGHVRNKSGSAGPSKLSNAIAAPLTPALEEVKTPGGSLVAPSAAGGFFSSMFSAAQNAANSLTNTITSSTSGQKAKTGGPHAEGGLSDTTVGEEVVPSESAAQQSSGQGERRQLAVETLGSGNLSLSHLGILDSTDPASMVSHGEGADHPQVSALRKDDLSGKADDDAAAKAVSAAYNEKVNGDRSTAPSVASTGDQVRPAPDESTPTRSLAEPDAGSVKRAGSVRSRLSSSRRRRTRGSSAATGTTAATLQATGQRPQGFAVANQKRNRDFHNLFKSVPEDDLLIEDYSAALQREILLHGRLYVSEGHVCFSSNILGWVTNLVISFDEIISVEKKSTAVIFQNGIVISTVHARNVFASLLNRDATYELIISMWKITHPHLKSTLNGSAVEGGGTGDKTEKAESVADADSASEELYDEDDTTDDEGDVDRSVDAVGDESNNISDGGDDATTVSRKASAAVGGATVNGTAKAVEGAEAAAGSGVVSGDFPGPPTHEPTDCGDTASHYDKLLIDATIPAPLGKIYSMVFGPAMGVFMRKWLIEDQKSTNLQLEDDKKGLGPDKKEMSFSYIKPLGGGIGPKQTTCNITMTLEQFDLEKAVSVAVSTQNPDVPSGNAFVTKTRYCLMWAPSNSTRLIMNYNIEWSGKSWIKGPIEKGTADGQLQYAKDLVAALKAAVTTKSIGKAGAKGKARGPKRRRDTIESASAENDAASIGAAGSKQGQKTWAVLESRSTLAVALTVCLMLGIIMFLLGRLSGSSGRLSDAYRNAQYERIWANEENELWTWLEERVGLEHAAPAILPPNARDDAKKGRAFDRNAKDMQQKLATEQMSERQVMEAIEITRQRLAVLEEAVKRNHRKSTSAVPKHEAASDAQPV